MNSKNSKTVLLVEDDRFVLHALSQGLARWGYRVLTAESADDAELLLIGEERPDIVVLDINMPGKNGLDLALRLQMLDQIPFIFLTANGDHEYIEKANQYGALSYLLKPIDPRQLGPVIDAALVRAMDIRQLKASEQSLQRALQMERNISLAIGITMMQYRMNRKDAYELLRNSSRKRRIRLAALAEEVIESAETLNFALIS